MPADPYGNYNFHVEIDGIVQASFQHCTGWDSSIDVIEHREGGDNISHRKLPGLTKHSNIQLKWGMTDDHNLYDWHLAFAQAKPVGSQTPVRKNGSIVIHDRAGVEKARWHFFNAWPARWVGPDFNAEGTDVAIETLELVIERLERA